jgi:transcription termination factor Rho
MTERRRPFRRGRRPYRRNADAHGEPNPYKDAETDGGANEGQEGAESAETAAATDSEPPPPSPEPQAAGSASESATAGEPAAPPESSEGPPPRQDFQQQRHGGDFHNRNDPNRNDRNDRSDRNDRNDRNGRRHRRNRRGRREHQQQVPPAQVVADTESVGWFDASRDGGYVRRAENSYLAEPGDAWVPSHLVRQFMLRRGDLVVVSAGRDHRGRVVAVEVKTLNGVDPASLSKRPDFGSLTATYPERRVTLETGRPARGGPELTRRCIDLMAPIGYGQRALIVAPARAGKTMLLHAITEGIALGHPNAVLLILLVDERPEEVSEAISWGVGEVIASSFDQPAARHVEVCEMVLEHARRLVEMGKDVVIVLDSLTRMARAHNTAERGSGRTLSGGLDSTAMAKPKAFFGSARAVHPKDGGGSLSIISTALVETGSRMDEVIFEEFKGTGNCEIKLDRSLAEKRIFPAFDIAASGTRREEKLYRQDQIDAIYTLRRGLQQMPPQAAMEWMIKRIANTQSNDALLEGL